MSVWAERTTTVSSKEAAVAFFLLVNAALLATVLAIFTRIATQVWDLNPNLAYLPFVVVFGGLFLAFTIYYKTSKKSGG